MEIRYRYVDYGTVFTRLAGDRPAGHPAPARDANLSENELVVDVGGRCWGYDGTDLPILDHHFVRRDGGQFPSAAAAVVHHAADIKERFGGKGVVWLVTHQQPDFDAYCSMFLARLVLLGEVPADGWRDIGAHPDGWYPGREREVNWYAPPRWLDGERRAAVLFAAYAAAVDNCKRLACPRDCALHSVLYAAAHRGRRLDADGALEFFQAAWKAVLNGANPLTDAVPLGDQFSPEVALLGRQQELYVRDMARARKAVVFVPQAQDGVDFHAWYDLVAGADAPVFDPTAADREPPLHDTPPRGPVDGVYLRDPECLLFKEWARQDSAGSGMGAGFLFTAIAYSSGRGQNRRNASEYVFSLDPERSGGANLYSVWSLLQAEEVRHRSGGRGDIADLTGPGGRPQVRKGYESRAGVGDGASYFDDPWFDGGNYGCTIVVTPGRGTSIAEPGRLADLSDDPVVALVRRELEFKALFASDARLEVHDVTAAQGRTEDRPGVLTLTDFDPRDSLGADAYRFARVELAPGIDLYRPGVAHQIGMLLWPHLHTQVPFGTATGGNRPCLVQGANWVGVWGPTGVAVAYQSSAGRAVSDNLLALFGDLSAVVREADRLITAERHQARPGVAAAVLAADADVYVLLERVRQVRHALAAPSAKLLGEFYQASNLNDILEAIAHSRQTRAQDKVQHKLKYVEVFLISVYAVEATHLIGAAFIFPHWYVGCWLIGAVVLAGVLAANYLQHPEDLYLQWAGRRLRSTKRVVLFVAFLAILYIGFGVFAKRYAPNDAQKSGGVTDPHPIPNETLPPED